MGQFGAVKAGDIVDLYLDIAADLAAGETISSVDFEVVNVAGVIMVGAVGSHTETDSRTDFRLTAPVEGSYQLAAVFTISDGQKLTRVADLSIV